MEQTGADFLKVLWSEGIRFRGLGFRVAGLIWKNPPCAVLTVGPSIM